MNNFFQTNKNTESLLDVDPSYGQGIYDAELQEPEHSNAGSTALWELPALQVGHLLNLIFFILLLFT